MNAQMQSLIDRSASFAEQFAGETFVYQGTTYQCIAAQGQPGLMSILQGQTLSQDWTIRATKGQFISPPIRRAKLTLRGVELTIENVDVDQVHYIISASRKGA